MKKPTRTLASRAAFCALAPCAAVISYGCASNKTADSQPAWYAASEHISTCEASQKPEGWPWSQVIVGWDAWSDWDPCQIRQLFVLPPN